MLGDALNAAAASGHVMGLGATAVGWQQTGRPVRPNSEVNRRYQALLSAYRELGERLAPIFDRVGSVS